MGHRTLLRSSFWQISYSSVGETAFPYFSETWQDGENERINHPYVDLIAHPVAIDSLPEVLDFPPLKTVLIAVVEGGVLLSTQCSPGDVLLHDSPPAIRRMVGAKLHIASRIEQDNTFVCHHVGTALALAEGLRPPPNGSYLGFSFTIEPYKSWRNRPGYYGLDVEFYGRGYSSEVAMGSAVIAAEILSTAIASLKDRGLGAPDHG